MEIPSKYKYFSSIFSNFDFLLTFTNLTKERNGLGKPVLTPMRHPPTSQSSKIQVITVEDSVHSLGQISPKDHVSSLI